MKKSNVQIIIHEAQKKEKKYTCRTCKIKTDDIDVCEECGKKMCYKCTRMLDLNDEYSPVWLCPECYGE